MSFIDYYLLSVALVYMGNVYDRRTVASKNIKYRTGTSPLLAAAFLWPVIAIFGIKEIYHDE